MFLFFKGLSKIFVSLNYIKKNTFCSKISSELSRVMSETKMKKLRYDGRSKKRKWEERRTDKGETIGLNTKHIKLENEEKIIDKIKRRKFVLLMGYSGIGYLGMQRNPSKKTIEEELFNALKNVGLISTIDYGQVQNLSFQRAARTDKNVSAARQVVSLKLPENINLNKINAELPDEIQVFSYKRVTKGFNSKSQCDGRTYTYMLPTIAFESQNKEVNQKTYRVKADMLNKVNDILKNFIGTKNFHNYTSKKKPNDPSASRYIKSFLCEEPFVRRDVEFVTLKVHGQSFMLHQIRKMVGALLAVVRGLAPDEVISKSFGHDKVCIPRAPGLGLMLDYVHYDRYNERYGEDGMHEKLLWEDMEENVNEFKEKYIYPTIINTEVEEESMIWWIENKLSRHSYDDADNNYESDEENGNNGSERKSESNLESKYTDEESSLSNNDSQTNKSVVC